MNKQRIVLYTFLYKHQHYLCVSPHVIDMQQKFSYDL